MSFGHQSGHMCISVFILRESQMLGEPKHQTDQHSLGTALIGQVGFTSVKRPRSEMGTA